MLTWAENMIAKTKYVKAMVVKFPLIHHGITTIILVTHVNIMNTTQNKRNTIILAMKIQISIQKQYVIDVKISIIVKSRIEILVGVIKKYI